MDFYERVEALRKERKMSQADLEKALGISNGSVSKWKKVFLLMIDWRNFQTFLMLV